MITEQETGGRAGWNFVLGTRTLKGWFHTYLYIWTKQKHDDRGDLNITSNTV